MFSSQFESSAIVLQSYLRMKYAQDETVFSSELKKAWVSASPKTSLRASRLEDFSLILARELKHIILDSNQHGRDIHFNKKKKYSIRHRRSVHSPLTFYIKVKHKLATIFINERKSRKSLIGIGAFKKIYSGIELLVPLNLGKDERHIISTKKIIARPIDDIIFEEGLEGQNKLLEIYQYFQSQHLPGYLAEPPTLKEHVHVFKKLKETKQELIQKRYPCDMNYLTSAGVYPAETGECLQLSLEVKFSLLEELFDTIASLSDLGIVHRDVKGKNVLIGEEKGAIHAYLHDFDLVAKNGDINSPHPFVYWDSAGKLGLAFHSSDIVGAMLTAVSLLFGTLNEKDLDHEMFKKGNNFAFKHFVIPYLEEELSLSEMLNINFSPLQSFEEIMICLEQVAQDKVNQEILIQNRIQEIKLKALAGYQIISLFCKYFMKEDSWKTELVGSFICHFTGLSAEEYEKTEYKLIIFKKKISDYAKEKLVLFFGDEIERYCNCEASEVLKILEREVLPTDQKIYLKDIRDLHDTLLELVVDIPAKGDPELYSLLSSNDSADRIRGNALAFQRFGHAKDIKNEISRIKNEYLEGLKKIKNHL